MGGGGGRGDVCQGTGGGVREGGGVISVGHDSDEPRGHRHRPWRRRAGKEVVVGGSRMAGVFTFSVGGDVYLHHEVV